MSRIVRQRFESATYDDAQGNLTPSNVPPTYPPRLQSFVAASLQTSALGFGTQTVTASAAISVFPGAGRTLVIAGDAANAFPVRLLQTSAQLVPGGPATELVFYVGPNQLVTIPGVLNSGTLVAQASNLTLTAVTTSPFTITIAGY